MKFFTAEQIKEWDAFTIKHKAISSVSLMERAALAFVTKYCHLENNQNPVHIFCGPGNNGGDGLAIARLLSEKGYSVSAYTCSPNGNFSQDAKVNLDRLSPILTITEIHSASDFPQILPNERVIDALFGTGISRPLDGIFPELISYLNNSGSYIYSVDIASGLFADRASENGQSIIQPNITLTFQSPKLAFFLPENEKYTGHWDVLEIGLSNEFYEQTESNFHYTTSDDARKLLKPRSRFSHKGTNGHALVWAGSYGKLGAALLSSKAVLKSGAGLLTAHIPSCGYTIFQTDFPDAMVETDTGERELTDSRLDLTKYSAIAVGPGIGQSNMTEKAFASLLTSTGIPLVIDADAINIMARRQELFRYVPASSIFTPHPKEFERLTQPATNSYERLQLLKEFCQKRNVYTVLKGAYSVICTPNGDLFFNTTGNPGMAKAGMGDVLTGIITGLLAQGYSPLHASILGTYLHGKSADLKSEKTGVYSLLASEVVENLGEAFLSIV